MQSANRSRITRFIFTIHFYFQTMLKDKSKFHRKIQSQNFEYFSEIIRDNFQGFLLNSVYYKILNKSIVTLKPVNIIKKSGRHASIHGLDLRVCQWLPHVSLQVWIFNTNLNRNIQQTIHNKGCFVKIWIDSNCNLCENASESGLIWLICSQVNSKVASNLGDRIR